jgi:hypothetical protein
MAVMVVVEMVSLDIQACFAVSKKKKKFSEIQDKPTEYNFLHTFGGVCVKRLVLGKPYLTFF